MKKLGFTFIALIVLVSLSTQAMAYTLLGGKLTSGVSSLNYYIDGTGYVNLIRTARNGWENASNSPVDMIEKQDTSTTQMDIYQENITSGEEADWIAWTTREMNSDGDWSFARVYLNEPWHETLGDTIFAASICHEMGHVMGLGENNSVKNSIMCQQSQGRTTNVPRADDINGINYIY